MDETDCKETDVFALVGLIVPIEKADAIRLSVHGFMRELEGVQDGHIHSPPELHGSKMLRGIPWATEEHCLRAYAHIVAIVNELRLDVIRAAYYKKSLTRMAPDQRLHKRMMYSLCFSGLERTIGPLLAEAYAFPIMDGIDSKIADPVGMSKPLMHAMRASPSHREGNITIANVQHLMDPVFVDSRHSSIMQVADVTAYLLHLLDWDRLRLPASEFKARLVAIAHTLDPELLCGPEPIWMKTL